MGLSCKSASFAGEPWVTSSDTGFSTSKMEVIISYPGPSPPPPGVIVGVCSELCIPAHTKHVVLPEGGTRSGLRGWVFICIILSAEL